MKRFCRPFPPENLFTDTQYFQGEQSHGKARNRSDESRKCYLCARSSLLPVSQYLAFRIEDAIMAPLASDVDFDRSHFREASSSDM
jgi:hypothetical protein